MPRQVKPAENGERRIKKSSSKADLASEASTKKSSSKSNLVRRDSLKSTSSQGDIRRTTSSKSIAPVRGASVGPTTGGPREGSVTADNPGFLAKVTCWQQRADPEAEALLNKRRKSRPASISIPENVSHGPSLVADQCPPECGGLMLELIYSTLNPALTFCIQSISADPFSCIPFIGPDCNRCNPVYYVRFLSTPCTTIYYLALTLLLPRAAIASSRWTRSTLTWQPGWQRRSAGLTPCTRLGDRLPWTTRSTPSCSQSTASRRRFTRD